MTIFSIAVICFKGSEEEGGIAQCINGTIWLLQKVLIVRSNIYDHDLFHWLRIGEVLQDSR